MGLILEPNALDIFHTGKSNIPYKSVDLAWQQVKSKQWQRTL